MSRSVQVHQFQWHIHDVVPAPAAAAEATDATDEPAAAAAALEYLNMLLYLFFFVEGHLCTISLSRNRTWPAITINNKLLTSVLFC